MQSSDNEMVSEIPLEISTIAEDSKLSLIQVNPRKSMTKSTINFFSWCNMQYENAFLANLHKYR